MLFRNIMMVAVVVGLAACSSTKDKTDMSDLEMSQREDITAGPLDGTEVYGYEGQAIETQGPIPGSQQDLVVNVGDRVFFGYDRYDLTAEAQHVLQMQAEWLKRYPQTSVVVKGHCDERGTREYNLALGERRANAAKNFLIALGVSPSRISTISYGKEQPAVLGSNEAAWAQNRRAVTEVE
ncbi:MAG: peptidoglycan-associated lipoprotein Pal [Alphaproteobacteria bacterium]|nr:peptidoglycan-associated lipoprotein Pal [Alphaproteobacteria bacterium]